MAAYQTLRSYLLEGPTTPGEFGSFYRLRMRPPWRLLEQHTTEEGTVWNYRHRTALVYFLLKRAGTEFAIATDDRAFGAGG